MNTEKPRFYNKNGDLSVYSFACGYIQQYKHENGIVDLYKEGCWHVKLYDSTGDRLEWLAYDSLTISRKQFSLFKTLIKSGTIKDFEDCILEE